MKRIKNVLICLVFVLCVVQNVFAGEWVQVGENWQYNDKGDIVKNDFKTIDGSYYYFDDNGNMVTGIVQVEGDLYAFGSDGKAMKEGVNLFDVVYNCTLKGKLLKADDLDKTAEECNAWLKENDKKTEIKTYHAVDNVLSQQLGICKDGEVIGWNKIGMEYRIVDNSGKKYAHDYIDIYTATKSRNTIYFDDNGNIRSLKWKNVNNKLQLVIEGGQAEYYKEYVYINGVVCKYNFLDKTISEEKSNQIIGNGFDENTYSELIMMDLEQTYQNEIAKAKRQREQEVLDQQKRQKEYEIQNRRKLKGYRKTANGSSIPVIEGVDAEIINKLIEEKYIGLVIQYVLDYYDDETLDKNYNNIILTTENVNIRNYENGQMDMSVTVRLYKKSLIVHLVYDPIKNDFIYNVNK